MRAHFWVPEPAPDLEGWDPDAAPERYSTGVGHNIYELYVRLQAAGERVTLGPVQPEDGVVVAFAKSLRDLSAQHALLRGLGNKPLMLIRSDIGPGWHPRFTADVEVMPYGQAVTGPSQIWVPALPQRGMLRRSAERFGRIRTVGFKGNPENLPAFMRDPAWTLTLEAMGLQWLADSPQQWGGSDHNWHDFSEVDVAVCLRAEDVGRQSWKPATKLINAWCAGAIPLVGPEPAYLELVTPQRDAFVVENESDVVGALERLQTEPALVQATEAAIETRAKAFAPEAVLEKWRTVLRRTLDSKLASGALRRRRRDRLRLAALSTFNKLRGR